MNFQLGSYSRNTTRCPQLTTAKQKVIDEDRCAGVSSLTHLLLLASKFQLNPARAEGYAYIKGNGLFPVGNTYDKFRKDKEG